MGLILQDESRTLTDRDVEQAVTEVVSALQRNTARDPQLIVHGGTRWR
jgi:phenylalanyl-tRNA synthetase beta subunit